MSRADPADAEGLTPQAQDRREAWRGAASGQGAGCAAGGPVALAPHPSLAGASAEHHLPLHPQYVHCVSGGPKAQAAPHRRAGMNAAPGAPRRPSAHPRHFLSLPHKSGSCRGSAGTVGVMAAVRLLLCSKLCSCTRITENGRFPFISLDFCHAPAPAKNGMTILKSVAEDVLFAETKAVHSACDRTHRV